MKNKLTLSLICLVSLSSCNMGSTGESISSQPNSEKESISSVIESEAPSVEESTSSISSPEEISSEEAINLLDKWEETDCYYFTYKQLGRDVMPIGAWCSPIGEFNNDQQYKYIKESGINSIYGLYERAEVDITNVFKALENAQNNDLVYLVRDASLVAKSESPEELAEYMSKFTKYTSYGGTLLVDEPGVKQLAKYETLRKIFRQNYSSSAFYINLFPNYASKSQLENGGAGGDVTMNLTYEEYLDTYIKTIKPQFLSYDYYGQVKAFPNVASGYFDQLELVARKCNESKIPFWPFIQTCEFGGSSRIPNEVDIYWQVNTALAYGAKGIQYFCYFTPTEFSDLGFKGNLIDKDGNKTEIYNYVSNINEQIARMDNILMYSTLVAQMAYNDSPAPINTDSFVTSFREIENIETDDDLLVSCFDYNGKSVFYFVNNNLTKNCEATVNFTSEIKANTYGKLSNSTIEGTSTSISLGAGESILIELTNYK